MLDQKVDWPPNYVEVWRKRSVRLIYLKTKRGALAEALVYYKDHPIEFIEDWCDTLDPRNAGTQYQVNMPFVLFKRQRELVQFLFECVKDQEPGLVEKSRDMGATWVCCAFSVWLFLFWPGASVGWGSRKEILVDRLGDIDSIFEKMRMVMRNLPPEFHPVGFTEDNMTHMKFINPENGASITGEGGDNIGRGGRKLIYFKDESDHYERPERIEAALGDNTRVPIDISSVNGLGTIFSRKREAGADWSPNAVMPKGRLRVFVMDWRDHPAKTKQWFDERKNRAESEGLYHLFAQEVERNRSAAVVGTLIPSEWVRSAIDAHIKLDIRPTGRYVAALDVADGGGDSNALAIRRGILLTRVEEWGARDVGQTARRAVGACAGIVPLDLNYDSIGVGSGVKAETNRLDEEDLLPAGLRIVQWNAASSVLDPRQRIEPDDEDTPRNEDFYKNLKAQAWWELRRRFERTHRAVTEDNFSYDPDLLISLPSSLPLLRKLEKELSQAISAFNSSMKLMVDKSPEGTKSPNLADAVVMAFWPCPGDQTLSPSQLVSHYQTIR